MLLVEYNVEKRTWNNLEIRHTKHYPWPISKILDVDSKTSLISIYLKVFSGSNIAFSVFLQIRYGLPRLDNAGLNVDSGNFNSPLIRLED